MSINKDLIIDLGMSEGNDTSFYLKKGFSVVGVEADPIIFESIMGRFKSEIDMGQLIAINRAAAEVSDESVILWRNPNEQGSSSIIGPEGGGASRELQPSTIKTIAWPELRQVSGIPYYMKIDIEGAEPRFLSSMLGSSELPQYISAECKTFEPINLFYQMGYRKFRLINQLRVPQFRLPNPPLEGKWVPNPPNHHWSGPFGRELPGSRWFPFDEISNIHKKLHELWLLETVVFGWIDCHACL